MMANVNTSKGPIIDPALCRCCHSIKKCRLLTAEYEFMGSKEVYSDIFMDVYGLLLSDLDGESKESCICATCVCRLRAASAFRRQVLQSEQMFLEARLQNKEESEQNVKIEIKMEPPCDAEPHVTPLPPDDSPDDPPGNPPDDQHDSTSDVNTDEVIKSNIQIKLLKKPRTRPWSEEKEKIKLKKAKKIKIKKIIESNKKIQRLQVKLDKLINTDKNPKAPKKTVSEQDKVFHNTITVVNNSYVVPFLNRISFYYCFYCKDQFTNPVELREHTLTHDPKRLFEDTTDYKKLLKIDITRIDCRLCNEKIDDINTFKNHISTVHNKLIHNVKNDFLTFRLTLNNLTCTECSSVFPYFDSLKKHMVDHFGTLTCDMCGACFLEPASLRTHIKSHTKIDINFPCEICGKNLKSKYSRSLHIATVHEKKPFVNCYKCDATFLSYALRNRHLIEVHGDKRTFPCELCDKVYNRRKTLMEHNRRNHLKVYRHQCDLCDQRFYLPSRLKEHVMAAHTGERNFRCEFCDKSYPRIKSLQDHIRTHNNERRYKCDVCSSTFTQSGSLKSHMKSHHQFQMDGSFN